MAVIGVVATAWHNGVTPSRRKSPPNYLLFIGDVKMPPFYRRGGLAGGKVMPCCSRASLRQTGGEVTVGNVLR